MIGIYRIVKIRNGSEAVQLSISFGNYTDAFAHCIEAMNKDRWATACLVFSEHGTGIFLRRDGTGIKSHVKQV